MTTSHVPCVWLDTHGGRSKRKVISYDIQRYTIKRRDSLIKLMKWFCTCLVPILCFLIVFLLVLLQSIYKETLKRVLGSELGPI